MSTRRNYRDDVAAFYRWALDEGRSVANPAERLGSIKVVTPDPRPLPDAVVRALLRAPDRVTRLMVHLAAYGGLRVAEIAQVRGEDVDRDGTQLLVRNGKGGRSRVIPLLPELAAVLTDAPPVGRLFPGANGRASIGPVEATASTTRLSTGPAARFASHVCHPGGATAAG